MLARMAHQRIANIGWAGRRIVAKTEQRLIMNMTSLTKWTAAICALLTGTAAAFADATLKVGDPAPKLQPGKWVQGDPVKEFAKGKAYIVEFWATWCGPCRVSIPHLNETYNKYKDKGLVVIGQDCWENDEKLVEPFLKSMGDKMTYRVALDDKNGSEKGKMADTWMAAADQNGIPTAFLVDTTGMIAWIGHPMTLEDKVIEDVLAGKFDVKKAAAEAEEQRKNGEKLDVLARALIADMRDKKWDDASTKVAEAEKLLPEKQKVNLDLTRFAILVGKKDYPAAYKLAMNSSDANKDNVPLQEKFAWTIATEESIEQRDLKVAETIARRANDAAKGENPSVLDTLARVQFMNGKKDEAIASEEKALKLVEGPEKDVIQKTLDSYKKGELPKPD
jgi:thiol-disulfide isomerase/thioredoxin